MSYAAPRTTVGFERVGNLAGYSPNPVPYELTGNTAFPKGAVVVMTNGLLALAGDSSEAAIVGVMAEEVKQADNPADKTTYGMVYDNPLDVFRASVAGHLDITASEGTTTRFQNDTEFHAGMRGSTIYIYEGPSKGAVRVTSAAHANYLDVYDPFPVAITSAS